MREPQTEAFLDRGQWTYEYEGNVSFDQIDIKYSSDNPARLNRKLDEDRVLQYAEHMQEGVDFPAIVLLAPSDLGVYAYDVATGMHRLSAADIAQGKAPKHIDAYVVTEADRYRRELLIRMLNILNGNPPTLVEQVMHIIFLHQNFKQSIVQLCKEWHVKENTVRTHLRAEQTRIRARQFGYDLDRVKHLSLTTLGDMNIVHSDKVFGEIIAFVVHHGVTNAQITEICKSAKTARDEQQALDIVRKFVKAEEERAEKARAKIGRTRPGPAQQMIANAARFVKQVSIGVDRLYLSSLTDADTMKVRALFDEMTVWNKRIQAELDRIERIHRDAA